MSDLKVIDSHFHVWNLDTQNLPWLDGTDGTITHTYNCLLYTSDAADE